jgi:hypothetical protein
MLRTLALTLVAAAALGGCRYGGTPLKSAQASRNGGKAVPGEVSRSGPSRAAGVALGESCASSDPERICIGLKYVVYQDPRGEPVSDERAAEENLAGVNGIWKQCGIGFQLERYEVVDPARLGLAYGGPAGELQSESARKAFGEPDRFVVVTTGPWHAGKNAWTNMPGALHAGAIIEGSVATGFPQIYAHELGHYLNLDHSGRSGRNVMSELISRDSEQLSDLQCEEARRSARRHWPRMLRRPGQLISRSGN